MLCSGKFCREAVQLRNPIPNGFGDEHFFSFDAPAALKADSFLYMGAVVAHFAFSGQRENRSYSESSLQRFSHVPRRP